MVGKIAWEDSLKLIFLSRCLHMMCYIYIYDMAFPNTIAQINNAVKLSRPFEMLSAYVLEMQTN